MIDGHSPTPAIGLDTGWPRAFAASARRQAWPNLPQGSLRSKQSLRLKLYIGLILVDIVCLAAAFALSGYLRSNGLGDEKGMQFAGMLVPCYLVIAGSGRAYCVSALESPKIGVERALLALAIAASLLIGLLFYLKTSAHFSRQIVLVGLALAALFLVIGRSLFGNVVGRLTNWRFSNDILLSDGAAVRPRSGEIVIIANRWAAADRDPFALHRLGVFLRNADRVILAASQDRRERWVTALKGAGIDVEVLATELEPLGPLELRRYGSHPTLMVGAKPLGIADSIKKRTLDLSITIPMLLLLVPVLLAISIAIRLDSPGPAFFRQPRVGQGNRIFNILKFRTMRFEEEDRGGNTSAQPDDGRLTRVGRFLRRTSLDELPQLVNVLAGDMSLVGPRPHALGSRAEKALFWEVDGRYWERHGIKPGITGLAQIRGFRGATETRSDLINRVQADLDYLVGWSLRRDLLILLQTLRVIVHPKAF